jgi:hypothetical protein
MWWKGHPSRLAPITSNLGDHSSPFRRARSL